MGMIIKVSKSIILDMGMIIKVPKSITEGRHGDVMNNFINENMADDEMNNFINEDGCDDEMNNCCNWLICLNHCKQNMHFVFWRSFCFLRHKIYLHAKFCASIFKIE